MNKTVKLIAAAIVISSVSCSQGPNDEWLDAEPVNFNDSLRPQGISEQGVELNGFSLQGFSLQGDELKGFTFASFENANGAVAEVTLNGTVFQGTDAVTGPISGAGFIGARLTAVRVDNTPLTEIRIEDVVAYNVAPPQGSGDPEITLYEISALDTQTGTRVNPCGERNGLPVLAVPVSGWWKYASGTPQGGDYNADSTLFTLSCRSGVIAKCVFFGYKPWKTIQECNGTTCKTLSMQPFHQACTRMMRNDRCGNGNSHTVNGTEINLYDKHGIQLDESTTIPLEAEWGIDGATCVKHHRWPTHDGQEVIAAAQADMDANCSHIDEGQAQATCGTQYSTFNTAFGFSTPLAQRALLRNDSQPPPSNGGTGGN
jgi:hypothetical protein